MPPGLKPVACSTLVVLVAAIGCADGATAPGTSPRGIAAVPPSVATFPPRRRADVPAPEDSSLVGWDEARVGLEADVFGRRWSLLFVLDSSGATGTDASADGRVFARLRRNAAGREVEMVFADTVVARDQLGVAPTEPPRQGLALTRRRAHIGPGPHGAPPRVCVAAWSDYATGALGLLGAVQAWAMHADASLRAAVTTAAAGWAAAFDALFACLADGH